ncbi:hypothetical protein KX729_09350 [Rhizobium sp. XQZ8]|uniref:DUF6894 family protein n=1 Tax=Rhizobium populisoli TaxID=2859785 RepID=UPI001CA53376|nr:hypothetical protein [Rhizobium populisoli]MBW6421645.1 hypothetical protein [Rhizobium populisoli]
MTRFFFDVINGHGLERDEIGIEMDRPDQIRREVSRILTDIAKEEMPTDDATRIRVAVRDVTGKPVYEGELFFRGSWSQQT